MTEKDEIFEETKALVKEAECALVECQTEITRLKLEEDRLSDAVSLLRSSLDTGMRQREYRRLNPALDVAR